MHSGELSAMNANIKGSFMQTLQSKDRTPGDFSLVEEVSTPASRGRERIYPDELDALDPNFITLPDFVCRGNPQRPTYKANDSSDLDLIELISPSHEFKRNLARGRVTAIRQHLQAGYMPSPCTSGETTARKQRKLLKKHKVGGGHRIAAAAPRSRPWTPANLGKVSREAERKARPRGGNDGGLVSLAKERQHVDARELQVVAAPSGYDFHPKLIAKTVRDVDEKATELRHISKVWHQECGSAVSIQQRLTNLLNTKYKKAFANGRMYTYEKCKHDDFKAEVGQILKRMETAGALQLPTLRVKQELAVECVDEVFGNGMGEEYMKLEAYYLQPNAKNMPVDLIKSATHVKKMAERLQNEYFDVQNVVGYMLDQLSLAEFGMRAYAL